MNASQPSAAFLATLDLAWRGQSHTFTGTFANAATHITATSDLTGIAVGAALSGPGIAPGALLTQVDNLGNAAYMSVNSTSAETAVTLTATGPGLFPSLQIGLYTNNPALTVGTVLSDLTEPTFTGYARVTPVLEAEQVDAAGNQIEGFPSVHFQPTGGTGLPATVQGYFLAFTPTGGSPMLLFAEQLPAPFAFTDTLTGLDIIVTFMEQNSLNWGGLEYVG